MSSKAADSEGKQTRLKGLDMVVEVQFDLFDLHGCPGQAPRLLTALRPPVDTDTAFPHWATFGYLRLPLSTFATAGRHKYSTAPPPLMLLEGSVKPNLMRLMPEARDCQTNHAASAE
ncbi:hypothetical protein DFH09DRAFT_1076713 [Mycena vulgaris]|nr:hypothetical protein DFH09DRAFT_1076713 [Mycena vulgaris]